MLGWEDTRPLSLFITPDRARKLADKPKLGTISDAVLNFPTKYVRAGSAQALDILEEGEMYTCVAEILSVSERENRSGRGPRSIVTFRFTDGAATMESALFGNPKLHTAALTQGSIVLLYGKLSRYRNKWQLKNPSYVSVYPAEGARFGAFGPLKTIVDVAGSQAQAQELLTRPWLASYGRKAGTSTAELIGVMDKVLRGMGHPTEVLPLPHVGSGVPDWPVDSAGEPLIAFDEALRDIHQPPPEGPWAAINRLKFNEALELQLVMALRRADAEKRTARAIVPVENGVASQLKSTLPFTLSTGQEDALSTVTAALNSTDPASLMLQGDVGSGKTIVALLSMLHAVEAGFQCAFIAPTEVLAAQHARTLTTLLEGTMVGVTLLTGSQKISEKKANLLNIVSGQSDIVVGTHALIQDSVEFNNLGFVVVDEQHRFGVRQRDKLREESPPDKTPHMLVMTATPIPRTVAMTMFGDLTSVRLSGMPAGRGRVHTSVVPAWKPRWVERMWQRMAEEIHAGRQVYVVVPRIDGEGGVEDWAERIQSFYLPPDSSIAVLHGRMASEEKDEVMRSFNAGQIDVLVATTVIEVGVDVPNATMMLIVDADSFGVSQLHQLRGRVGRGTEDAVCLLHTTASEFTPSFQRLEAVATTHDGFALAELDLQQRTEGDILGQRQSGSAGRRSTLLHLVEDEAIIVEARRYAHDLVAYDELLARSLVANLEIEEQEYIERS
ncbi:ATP-dependent DNA helicase RecG [Corynebacterium anserum]|uniref:DEAD/DEAH box helicase n=1 Tax=Corynebacterium anserum TaxID=2684406 RepID=A0A7G7YNY5_9CORY|nr:ATP-dependent DNA helicase RecG [Corynebacterium anserum]MBC2681804.1 DEAD/DEAH box helicase [Corynebacterium anserum]QNH96205.1 DEAD/DEAH box helicase [Corynebacterium anserum]